MRNRPLLWSGQYIHVDGDQNRMILHFHEPADLILGQGLYHPGLGRVMKYADGVPETLRKGILKVHSIAFLKGRGVWAKIENVTNQRMSQRVGSTSGKPPMFVGGEIQEDSDTMVYTFFEPHGIKWHKTWFVYDMVIRTLYPPKGAGIVPSTMPTPAPNVPETGFESYAMDDGMAENFPRSIEITQCIQAWAKLYSYSGTNLVHDAVLSCLDGLTPTLKDCHNGKSPEPLATLDLSINYTQGAPVDGLKPVSDSDLMGIEVSPYYKPYQIRRLMRYGGVKEFIKMATGTDCKSVVKVMVPHLLEIPKTARVTFMVNSFDGVGIYGKARVDLLRNLHLVERFEINHRVRFVNILMNFSVYSSRPSHTLLSILRVFDSFNITKVLNKIEEEEEEHRLSPQPYVISVLNLVCDIGSMLLQADKIKLEATDRQKRMFPDGVVPKKWKTIEELHDDVSRKFTKYKTLGQSKRLDWHEKVQSLHGSSANGLRILLPRTKSTVAKWGALQNHCIASYADRMEGGDNVLFGVYQEEKLMYCGRLEKTSFNPNPYSNGTAVPYGTWRLGELRGQNNKDATISDVSKIVQILYDNGIDIDSWLTQGYGGVPKGFEKTKNPTVEVKKPEIVVKNFTKIAIDAVV